MHQYPVSYAFNGEPRQHTFELEDDVLPEHLAALHLLQLHFGDSENSLIMPTADASPREIVQQAGLLGITQVRV
ncbi:MAG: hypothetical protein PW845_27655 [Pseudomonas sp.]|nr:hypothetical protein [Pseudomonas sp. PIA16]MDE1169057.1 hypothetical protein [Pseudomonas sp.]